MTNATEPMTRPELLKALRDRRKSIARLQGMVDGIRESRANGETWLDNDPTVDMVKWANELDTITIPRQQGWLNELLQIAKDNGWKVAKS